MKELKNFKKSDVNKNKTDEAGSIMGKYEGFSEDQLIEELLKSIKKSKEGGTYSFEQMKSFAQLMSPQLTEEQRIKLTNLISLIEEDEL